MIDVSAGTAALGRPCSMPIAQVGKMTKINTIAPILSMMPWNH